MDESLLKFFHRFFSMNLSFYHNKLAPSGIETIENIFSWNHSELEDCHCYIQWLFPMHDEVSSFNYNCERITLEESTRIRENIVTSLRALCAFELMLHFMGFEIDKSDWTIKLSDIDRIHFINNSRHNFLRITRMLKSMNFIGLGCFRKSFLNALREQILNRNLINAYNSYKNYWSTCIFDEDFFSSGMRFLKSGSKDKRIFYFMKILTKTTCMMAKKMLMSEISFVDLPFPCDLFWLVLAKQNMNYIVMNEKNGVMKVAPLHEFTYVLTEEGCNLTSSEYVGLYVWDKIQDISNDQIDYALLRSYAFEKQELKFVHLIRVTA